MGGLPTFGALAAAPWTVTALALAGCFAVAYLGVPLWVYPAVFLLAAWLGGASAWIVFPLLALTLVAALPPLRRVLVTQHVFTLLRKLGVLPTISETEREAIEAGDVWVDRELFDGKPDLTALSNTPWPELSERERALIDGPVVDICRATDNWQVQQDGDLPDEIWQMLREHGLFGMIVPEQWGGLGLSAAAQSTIITKLASRSLTLAITVMVPNSLGPAELLLRYGTDEQKAHWLNRLATGVEIPCFALTEPHAGSDAAAMRARGVAFKDDDGVVRIRLDWDKRYITLAPIATVLGLAFQLEDPENLLGRGEKPGITCALIPADTEGVETGRAHDPLGVPFHNGVTRGEGVVIDVHQVIGGPDGLGKGWRMLMECLAAGRGISLPATSVGGAQLASRVATAHAGIRKQFGLEIGRFEGIEEPLARIASKTWMLDAARRFLAGGLDAGAHPPVVTAIAKYRFTETWREVITDAMDVVGGAGIVRGPNNLLAEGWIGTPISITVEGANILTRTLMVFGQGAIRCHRYTFDEITALETGDRKLFDRAFTGHAAHVIRNLVRSIALSVTRGRLAHSPVSGPTAKHWRRLAWVSASFASSADFAMAGLGGELKRRERLTGRYADVFSWMLMITAALRRFEAEGRRAEDLPLLHFACEDAFARIDEAFDGIRRNLVLPGVTWWLRGPLSWLSRLNRTGSRPSDRLGSKVARAVLTPGEVRDRLTRDIHLASDPELGLGRLENAFTKIVAAQPAFAKLKQAVRSKQLPKERPDLLLDQAVEIGVLDAREADLVREAERARDAAIQVDAFERRASEAQPDPAV